VISNQTRAACSFDFEITRMISDQIALHSVQLPLLMPSISKIYHISEKAVGISLKSKIINIPMSHCNENLGEGFHSFHIPPPFFTTFSLYVES